MKTRFRRIIGRTFGIAGLILLALALIILVIDKVAGHCPVSPGIANAIESVSAENLGRDVAQLSRMGSRFGKTPKSAGIKESREVPAEMRTVAQNLSKRGMTVPNREIHTLKVEYIEEELRKIGLQPVRQTFQSSAFGFGINLYAEHVGKTKPDQILDVSAHYDTFAASPGADDNNSGVAGVLEIARIVSTQKTMDRTVRFVFFDLEELGLIGSRAFVQSIKAGDLAEPAGLLNLETIGYYSDEPNSQKTPARIPLVFDPPTTGNMIVTVGNLRSYRLARRLDGTIRSYTPELPIYSVARWGDWIGSAARSDHLAYWEHEIPAAMLTDTANFRNPNYHQPGDLPNTLNYKKMELVVKGAAAFVLDWATDYHSVR